MEAKVHRAPMQGIVGSVHEGATSIVVNDGYEDDIDEGDVMYVHLPHSCSTKLTHDYTQLVYWCWGTGKSLRRSRYHSPERMTQTDLFILSQNRKKLIKVSNTFRTVNYWSVMT
jgi:hypothetical protein